MLVRLKFSEVPGSPVFKILLTLLVQSHGRYVSADANFSERVHPEV